VKRLKNSWIFFFLLSCVCVRATALDPSIWSLIGAKYDFVVLEGFFGVEMDLFLDLEL
jgi:hypothetical protein